MQNELTFNGKKIVNYTMTEKGVLIPLEEIFELKPVYGSLATAYFCPSEKGPKKWKAQIGNKNLAKILEKEHLGWFETRKECEVFIKKIDGFLRF